MKKIMSILCIGCFCAFAACNSGSSNSDSVDSANNINDSIMPDSNSMMNSDTSMSTMSSAPVSQEDADWAVKVANANMTEVELSKVAQTKAASPRLKNFADMMVTDHTAAGNKLTQLAGTKNITLPANLDDKSQKKLDDLNKKTGSDFNKEYTKDMLGDHKDAVDLFKKGSNDLKDADLKSFASTTLPTLQMHLDSIKVISGKK
ncbi:MAG: DUF4142 domain-containing protein [Parafilimonas sp.]